MIFVGVALAGSLLVSYVQARAEALGFEPAGGLLGRPERVLLTVVGLVVVPWLVWVLGALAMLTQITVLQRILSVWQQSSKRA